MFSPQVLIGIGLIIYSYFLTPAFWDPTDFFFTPFYVTLAYTWYGELSYIIVPLWMASGYLAMVWGIILIGNSAKFLRGINAKASILVRHPLKVSLVVFGAALIVSLFLLQITGNIG